MTGMNLRRIIPVGRLAIDAFFPPSQRLDEIIGKQLHYNQVSVIPLPHPGGISRWHQKHEHIALIYQALEIIRSVGIG